jgi:FMN-dependent NADH-azoreductase
VNILHLDSSPQGLASVTREVAQATVTQLLAANSTAIVSYRDLAAEPIAHLGGALLLALRQPKGFPVNADLANDLALTESLIVEFLAADVVVIGAPMYNFSIPTQLKAWIDRIAQVGRTFRYTEVGPMGLADGKKVIVISSRGGAYAGLPMESALDHQEAYLRVLMGFLGVTDIEVIRAENVGHSEAARAKAIAGALEQVAAR